MKRKDTGEKEEEEEEDGVRKRELRQTLIINFGHNPLRKSSEENQDVAEGSGGGEIQFHSTYLVSSLHLLNPCNMFCHTCPALHATDTFALWSARCLYRNN